MNKTEQLLPLKDIYLPSAPSIFPLAIGWWLVIVFTIIFLALTIFFIYHRYTTYRRYNALLNQWNAVKNAYQKHQNLHLLAQASSDFLRRLIRYQLNDSNASCLDNENWYAYLTTIVAKSSANNIANLESLREVITNGAFNPKISYDSKKLFDLVEQIIYQVSKK